MSDVKEVKLPSGAVLKFHPAPFADSKSLWQAILEEGKDLYLDQDAEIDVNLYKDMFCSAMSSKKVEAALDVCMKRALYNDSKIDASTFEPLAAREDYIDVIFAVGLENILPFMKSLYAKYYQIAASMTKLSPA